MDCFVTDIDQEAYKRPTLFPPQKNLFSGVQKGQRERKEQPQNKLNLKPSLEMIKSKAYSVEHKNQKVGNLDLDRFLECRNLDSC